MKRTVLYVVGVLGAGGAERQLLTLLRCLDRTRWNPVVVGTESGVLVDEFRELAPLVVLDKKRKVDVNVPLRIRNLIREHSAEVVHGYLTTGNTWSRIGTVLAADSRIIRIASQRSMSTEKTGLMRLVDRALLGCTDMITANSTAVANCLLEMERVPERMVRVIPNGLELTRAHRALGWDTEKVRKYRESLGFSETDFVVTHIGRPNETKNLDLLLRVFHRIHDRYPHTRLMRVSQDPAPWETETSERFKRDLVALGLSSAVVQHPYTPQVSDVYAISDALIQTSRVEGMPNVVMEALAMEVPVVATAAGGTTDLVLHRKTGWLTGIYDEDALVHGLQHVIEQPEAAVNWARAGRERIEAEFTDRVMSDRTMALYDELIRRRGDVP